VTFMWTQRASEPKQSESSSGEEV